MTSSARILYACGAGRTDAIAQRRNVDMRVVRYAVLCASLVFMIGVASCALSDQPDQPVTSAEAVTSDMSDLLAPPPESPDSALCAILAGDCVQFAGGPGPLADQYCSSECDRRPAFCAVIHTVEIFCVPSNPQSNCRPNEVCGIPADDGVIRHGSCHPGECQCGFTATDFAGSCTLLSGEPIAAPDPTE